MYTKISKILLLACFLVKSTMSSADEVPATALPELNTPAEYCELVMTDPSVLRFSNYMKSVFTGLNEKKYAISDVMNQKLLDYDIDIYASVIAYPDNQTLVQDWANKQIEKILEACIADPDIEACKVLGINVHKKVRSDPYDRTYVTEHDGTRIDIDRTTNKLSDRGLEILSKDIRTFYMGAVYKQCGAKLLASPLNGTVLISQLRINDFNRFFTKLDSCQKAEPKKEKRVLDDGTIQTVELPKDCSSEESQLYRSFYEASILPKSLMFKNGSNLFKNASAAALDILEPKLQADIGKHNTALAADAKEKKLYQDKVAKLKSTGDFSNVTDCGPVGDAVGAVRPPTLGQLSHDSYKAQIQPTNNYYYLAGELNQLNGNVGYLKGPNNGEFSYIKLSNNMGWVQKDAIRVGSNIIGIGKYVANTSITLTSGQSITAPVYEVVCFQPFMPLP